MFDVQAERKREREREKGRAFKGARGKHLKLLRAMLIQRVRSALSRIAMLYIIISAAIRATIRSS